MSAGGRLAVAGRPATGWLAGARTELAPWAATVALPFVLILYLALQGGGYDAVIRSEVGVAVWWLVLLGAVVGVLPRTKLTRPAWIGLGLFVAFATWAAVAITWSESDERTVAEVSRLATYLGVLVLAIGAQGADGLRRTACSVGFALGLVGALALMSRLHPSWFPTNEAGAAFEQARGRLNYPVNYWNGLAAMMAIGIPLMLGIALAARRIAIRAFATALVPLMAVTAFYTLSRGGAIEVAVGFVAFVVLWPSRLSALPTLLLATAGSALLIVAATQRDALEDGLATQAALDQGDSMLAFVVVVGAGVGLVRAGLALAERYELMPAISVSRRATAAAATATLLVAVAVAGAAGAGTAVSDGWEEFKQPITAAENTSVGRFESASGNGRYQWWETALDATATDPLKGIGPGTFEYYWAREGSLPGFVRDAHSLFFETAAELGIPGLLLVSALIFGIAGFACLRAFTASATQRPWFAAIGAAMIAFAAAAAIDWVWELAVIPAAFMLLAGAALNAKGASTASAGGAGRGVLVALSVVALVTIAIPLAGTSSVRASQAQVNSSDLGQALDSARSSAEIQPWAATPNLQEALVLELAGDLDAAAAAARAATSDEPTNWRTWLVLSRIEAYRGDADTAVDAYRRARSLNARSALFAR